MGHLSLGCRPTPFCLYRIAETRLSVASDGREKRDNRVRGSVDGSRRPETLADFGEAGAKLLAGLRLVEQAQYLFGHSRRSEVLLNELGNDAAPGDQVHHTEVRRLNQGLGEQGG